MGEGAATRNADLCLAVVVSPEALFTLTDLCGLTPDDAVTHCVRLATAITAAALKRTET